EIAAWLPERPAAPGARITDRAAWERLAKEPQAARFIRAAESLLNQPVDPLPDDLYLEFTRNGNRKNYETPYFRRTSQLSSLVLGECLENKGRFLPAIEARILAICGERSWTMPAHDASLSNFNETQLTIDLGSSARSWLLALTYDWLQDSLAAPVRTALLRETGRRVLTPYRMALESGNLRGNWWITGNNNWNAVCQAGVLGTALALIESREERAYYLAAIDRFYAFVLSGFTDDGYCSEGMGYWNYGFGHAVMLGLMLREATGGRLDLFTDPKNRKVADYARGYQLQPGKSPWFADGGGGPGRNTWALMRQIWPDLVPTEASRLPLLSGDLQTLSLRGFGQEPPPPADTHPAPLPMRTWFDRAQVLICRQPANGKPPFSLALKGGHNAEQHNHNDVGSYTIMLDGVEMAGDPGGEVYTRRTFSRDRYQSKVLNSYGHPVPVINGTLQPAGRQREARVTATAFTDAADTLTLDLARAYPVPALTRLERSFRYDRAARSVTVTDSAAFNAPATFSVPVITYRTVVPGDTPDTFWLEEGTRRVKVTITVTGGSWKLTRETIENPSRPSVTRLAITLNEQVKEVQVTVRFEA
ncbi:MAG: heparinase II/III family protein, partial [Kiritimatiellae bacterium]|nr:heparinase II/III family protein [Kiritimatiellia bacterium]